MEKHTISVFGANIAGAIRDAMWLVEMQKEAQEMKPHILVVDDDPLICHLLKYQLEDAGYFVTIVRNGHDALQQMGGGGRQPDLVLLDVVMPDMSGWEVCKKIRAHSTIPVIMLTARNSEHDALIRLSCGATDYISKPFRFPNLSDRIETFLRRSRPEWFTGKHHPIRRSYHQEKRRLQKAPGTTLASAPKKHTPYPASPPPLPWPLYLFTLVAGSLLLAMVSYVVISRFWL